MGAILKYAIHIEIKTILQNWKHEKQKTIKKSRKNENINTTGGGVGGGTDSSPFFKLEEFWMHRIDFILQKNLVTFFQITVVVSNF